MNTKKYKSPHVSRKTYARFAGGGIRKIWLHIIFCLLIFIVFLGGIVFYLGDMVGIPAQIGYVGYCLFLLCIYAGRELTIRYLLRGKTMVFSITILVAVILLTFFGGTVLEFLFSPRRRLSFDQFLFSIFPIFTIGVSVGVFAKLLVFTFEKQYLDAEQKQGQLDLLRSQLSPHFLFNTLNNMYGISIRQHEKIPVLLLKLSELLRYSLYESEHLLVPLSEEITYINNYIEFEKIRIGDKLKFTSDFSHVAVVSVNIAPMLLIVFVENAFKHAKNTFEDKVGVHIELYTDSHNIYFTVRNTYQINNEEEDRSSAGLGLRNTLERLDLVYGKDYNYIHSIEDGCYAVRLQLKIK